MIFNPSRSGRNKISHILKKPAALSMYDLLLPPGLEDLKRFSACYEFVDNFIEVWLKFEFEQKT